MASLDAALTTPAADAQPGAATPPDPAGLKDALLQPSQSSGLSEPTRLPQIADALDPGVAPQPQPAATPPAPGDAAPAYPPPVAPHIITPQSPSLPPVKSLESTLPTVLKPAAQKPVGVKPAGIKPAGIKPAGLALPGLALPGLAQPGLPQPGLPQPALTQPGLAQPLLKPGVPGVQTDALPQIGDPPKTQRTPAADQPIAKFARTFDAPAGKPRFVILLQDVGAAGMARAELAKLPFPVSFVIDPLASDAKAAAQTYRDAGQEVLILANGLPPGATAGDVAQTFQSLAGIVPEAVGVVDEATLGFQDNRALASLVLPVIADQGRGLLTYDRGLNAADQIARRDGLPAAVIFRRLDGAGESGPTIRRYLDRAAFKAAQEGSVVVIGDTRADTVAAILEWTVAGKGATMALAPVTAVLMH